MARPTSSSSAEAIITEGTHVRGRISGEGALRVLGQVEGDVVLRGDLHVGVGGSLKSNIDASSITIDGDVEGTVTATSGSITVGVGARLLGDVHAARFQLEEGGEFTGNLAHDFDLPTELNELVGSSKSSTSPRRR